VETVLWEKESVVGRIHETVGFQAADVKERGSGGRWEW